MIRAPGRDDSKRDCPPMTFPHAPPVARRRRPHGLPGFRLSDPVSTSQASHCSGGEPQRERPERVVEAQRGPPVAMSGTSAIVPTRFRRRRHRPLPTPHGGRPASHTTAAFFVTEKRRPRRRRGNDDRSHRAPVTGVGGHLRPQLPVVGTFREAVASVEQPVGEESPHGPQILFFGHPHRAERVMHSR